MVDRVYQFTEGLVDRDTLIRAGKTFLQAALATAAAGVAGIVDVQTAKAVVIGAIAAGIAAVWNGVLKTR